MLAPAPLPTIEVARARATAWSVMLRTTGRVTQRTARTVDGMRVMLANR
jgi:hypothetical protein